MSCLVASLSLLVCAVSANVPFPNPLPYPRMEAWTFREELAKPEPPARFAAIGPTNAPYWVRNRISRCYFGPIKRDAAGVSWYRRVAVASDGTVSIPALWNSVSPAHEIARSSVRRTPEGLAVSFTLAAAGWGGRDDRRPGWIQLIDEKKAEPLWPAVEHPDAKDSRLNLSPLRATIFGRLISSTGK